MARWFSSIDEDNDDADPALASVFALVRSIDSDAAWRRWWSGSGFKRLVVVPIPTPLDTHRPLVSTAEDQTFVLGQPSPGLNALMEKAAAALSAGADYQEDSAAASALVTAAIRTGLDNVGMLLGLGPGPGRADAFTLLPSPQPVTEEQFEHFEQQRHRFGSSHLGGPPSHDDEQSAEVFASRSTDGTCLDPLPPAHPTFAAHFTHRIYETGDDGDHDTLPFGTDEGSDTVWEWSGRVAELQAIGTLRGMLEIEDSTDWGTGQDDDDLLIAGAFTLMRTTGRIDPEGRALTLAALDRRVKGVWHDKEYRRMRKDLRAFPADES